MQRVGQKILVLNSDYQPLNVTSFRKGYKLLYKGIAEVVKSDSTVMLVAEDKVQRPRVIRLLKYLYMPYRKIQLCRQNIFKRDNHTCVYCGTNTALTLDHILPRSRGGQNTWENLVTCCFKCNNKKGDSTPTEAKMTMRFKAFTPTFLYMIELDEDMRFDFSSISVG